MDTKQRIEFLYKNFENLQSLIALADRKANTSLTLQTFIIGFIYGSLSVTRLYNKINIDELLLLDIILVLLLFIFTISTIVGIIYCLLIYKARFPIEKSEVQREGFFYFNHIVKYSSSNKYYDKILSIKEDDQLFEMINQIYNVAHIVSRKMKYVNATIWFLMINICLAVLISAIAIIILIQQSV